MTHAATETCIRRPQPRRLPVNPDAAPGALQELPQ